MGGWRGGDETIPLNPAKQLAFYGGGKPDSSVDGLLLSPHIRCWPCDAM